MFIKKNRKKIITIENIFFTEFEKNLYRVNCARILECISSHTRCMGTQIENLLPFNERRKRTTLGGSSISPRRGVENKMPKKRNGKYKNIIHEQ